MRNDLTRGKQGYGRSEEFDCPFYGLHPLSEIPVFMNNGGNRCGLVFNAYHPCDMEVSGIDADWKLCGHNCRNNHHVLGKLADEFSVYLPGEEGGSMSFRDWFFQVMEYPIDDELDSM